MGDGPYDDLGFSPSGGNDDDDDAVTAFGNSQEAQTQYTPDEVVAQDWFRMDLFGNIDESELVGNQSMYYDVALTNPDYASTFAVQRTMEYWTQIYGGNLAPIMQAALSKDAGQYKLLQRLIANIAQMDMDPIAPRGPAGNPTELQEFQDVEPQEILLTALQDPTYVESLPSPQRNRLITLAREAQESLVEMAPGAEGQGLDQLWVFRTIAGQTRSGNYDVFLNGEEKELLDRLVDRYGTETGKGEKNRLQASIEQRDDQALEDMLGVTSVEGTTGEHPRLVLDQAWARAHPIKAAAVMDAIRERHPGVTFQVGENGIVGEALDLWGRATDVVAIPFSWAGGNLARWIDETREASEITPKMREDAAQHKAELEEALSKGQVPIDEVENTLRLIRYADDLATSDYDYGWSEAVDNGIHPRNAGTAFGDTLLDSVSKEPGDPGMGGIYAVANLFQGLVFDPLNYVVPFASGARAGLRGVAAAGEAKGVIDTTVTAFRNTEDLAGLVKNGRHAIFRSDDTLEGILRGEGYKPQKVTLRQNGELVDALFVPNVTPEMAVRYAANAGQAEVITREGLITVGDRTIRPLKNVKTGTDTALAENTVKWGANRGWAYDFTKKGIRMRPPRIGNNWLRSKAFQMFAPTPEELIASPHMHAAAERIIRMGNEVNDIDQFSGWLARSYELDPIQARQFAHAQTPEEVLQLFYMSITGGIEAPFNAARHGSRMTELAKRLDAGDAADARLEVLRSTPQDELVSADELNEIHADLTGGAQREGFLATDQYAEDIMGALAKRVKVAAPGRIDDITENLSSYEKYLFRTHLQKLRIAKSNIINAPEKLKRGRDFAGGGRFFTDIDVATLRNRELLESGGAAQYRVRKRAQGGDLINRSPQYLDDLKAKIKREGFTTEGGAVMVEVLPSGKITILDGTHRLMLAEELGISKVPVQFNTNGLEVADRTYVWLEQHAPKALEVTTPLPDDLVELTKESRLFYEAEETAQGFRATREADVAELGYLRSISQGRTWRVPIRKMPTRSLVKRTLTKSLEQHEFAKGMEAMADFAEKGLPLHLARNARVGVARVLGGPALATSEKAAKTLNHWMSKFIRNHGAGSPIDLGRFGTGALTDADGKIIRLVDDDIKVVENLRNMAKVFGLKNSTVDELMGGFINAKGLNGRKAAYDKYWETISTEAKGVGALERKAIARWSNTELMSRNPGYISGKLDNGINDARPTHWSLKTAPDGTVYEAGRPVFSADALHTVYLPSIEEVLNWISFNRRLLNSMKQGNKVRKFLGGGATVIHETWHIANQSIKTLLLAFRMPLALPLRIVSEEHLRMAAFDNATLVNHPLEWFKMFRGTEEYALFKTSQTEFLGLLHEQFLSDWRLAKVGRRQVVFGMDDDWYEAMSVRLQQIAKSSEVRGFYIDDLGNPKRVLERMEGPAGRARGVDDILNMWDEAIDPGTTGAMKSRLEATERALGEIKQLVGQGPAAERIRKAIKSGRYTDESGKVFELGSAEFAAELKRVVEAGEWAPDAKVLATTEKEYLYLGNKLEPLKEFRDSLFGTFYTGIDAAVARRPLWRGLARREYNRLISLGWKPDRAKRAAEALAYRQTADQLYRIGETSTGHHFARNISPFLPAFQELTTTWLYRIPKEMGAGFLAPGYARLARKADVWFTFMKDAGIVQERIVTNPDTGEQERSYFVPVPLLGDLMGAVFNVPGIQATASLESFTGILPDPTKGPKALIPGLGSPTSYLLGEFANQTDIADELVDALLPFGREATLGPSALNRLFAAAGIVPFWEAGTSDYQRHLINTSVDDGIQIAFLKYGDEMPKRGDFKVGAAGERKYVEAHRDWAEKIVSEGEKWASLRFLTRGVGSLFLPFSVNFTHKQKDELQTIWSLINSAPESERSLASPLIDAFKETYPDAVWFAQGKSINLFPDRDFSVGDPYFNQISEGMRDELTPMEYLRYAVGMNSYYVYINRRNQALREAGDNPLDILTHGFDKGKNIQRLDAEWNQYLALTEEEAETGTGRSFAELFDVYQDAKDEAAARQGEGFDITVDDQYMLDVKKGLQALSDLFTENGVRDGDYRKILGVLSDAGSGVNYPEPTTREGKAIAHWYDSIAADYYEQTGAIYDLISVTDKRLRAPLYEQLRQLANAQKRTTFEGYELPTPEEVAWGNLSQREQDIRLVEWAKLQPEWLTNFQMSKLGIGGDPKALDVYATYANEVDQKFRRESMLLHPSSTDYQNMQAFYDGLRKQKAEELGLGEIYSLGEAPPWLRIDRLAADNFKNESWDQMIQFTTDIWTRLASADVAVAGSTDTAVYYQKWLVDRVEQMKAADPEFRKLLDRVKAAFVPSGSEDMGQTDFYWKFLFDGFLDSAPSYLVYGGDE